MTRHAAGFGGLKLQGSGTDENGSRAGAPRVRIHTAAFDPSPIIS